MPRPALDREADREPDPSPVIVDPPASTLDELIRRRLLYPITEAAYMLGLSEKTLRRRIADGALETVRDGRRVFITADELDRYVTTLRAS